MSFSGSFCHNLPSVLLGIRPPFCPLARSVFPMPRLSLQARLLSVLLGLGPWPLDPLRLDQQDWIDLQDHCISLFSNRACPITLILSGDEYRKGSPCESRKNATTYGCLRPAPLKDVWARTLVLRSVTRQRFVFRTAVFLNLALISHLRIGPPIEYRGHFFRARPWPRPRRNPQKETPDPFSGSIESSGPAISGPSPV